MQKRWIQKDEYLKQTISKYILNRNSTILVVCGGHKEKKVLIDDLRFKNVLITNIDQSSNCFKSENVQFEYQDCQNLTFKDNMFDFVLVHDGLHHCRQPHKALLEMYRVCKLGCIAFEARDSLLVRMANKFGFSEDYEVSVAKLAQEKIKRQETVNSHIGGVDNTGIPNYVFRWTEREIEKTFKSFEPHVAHQFHYDYSLVLPNRFDETVLGHILYHVSKVLSPIFKKQGNLFTFFVKKGQPMLQPWIAEICGQYKLL
jgi:ubiquinone/menaquinone biosynthesis C-methylase UbiE